MRKIIAIGGGEIGWQGRPIETTKIDKEIIHLSGKKNPRLLFVSTASSDAQGYIETVQKYFGRRLGCRIDTLQLIKEHHNLKSLRSKIFSSDIIYVGGGNTQKMMKVWRRYGVDKLLRRAYDKGIVLSGLSAGAICWFRFGLSDSRRFKSASTDFSYIRVKGLNLISLTVSPHHIREKKRKSELIKLMKRTSGVGIALDDCSALEVVNGTFRIITSRPIAKAHKVFYKNNQLIYKEIKKQKAFLPLKYLIEKD